MVDNTIKPSWMEVKLKLIQLLGGLFMERDESLGELGTYVVSLGKLAFWCVFVPALYIWLPGGEITSNHLTTLLTLLAYNFSKKAIGAAQSIFTKTDNSVG